MKNYKKLFSLLSALLLAGNICFPAWAAENETKENIQSDVSYSYSSNDAGTAIEASGGNEDISWILTVDGVLIISGNGEWGWDCFLSTDDREKVTSVIIGDGVTSIARGGFSFYENMTSISILSSVTDIGDEAFWYCSSLTDITIPSSVTNIGYNAFEGCSSLKNINLSSGITSIADRAFWGCSSLTDITIPSSVANIGNEVFYDCASLTSINVDDANKYFCSVDGILFNKDMTKLLCFPAKNAQTSYDIPDSVTDIGAYAFYRCGNLNSVKMPDGLKNIGTCAFGGCNSFVNVDIPDSVTDIESGAFASCKNLISVEISNNVTKIPQTMFAYCSSLKNIVIPSGVTELGNRAFIGCSSLTDITIPSNVTEMDAWVFMGCDNLKKVYVLGHITYMEDSIFDECSGLSDIYYVGSKEEWEAIVNNDRYTTNEYIGLSDSVIIHYNYDEKQLSEEMFTMLIQEINSSDIGGVVEMETGSATIIPREILEALQSRRVNLCLTLEDGTCWSINGQDIESAGQDMDLSVKRSSIDAGAIPVEQLNSISGTREGEQIEFLQQGLIGFDAHIVLPAEKRFDGKKAVFLNYENEDINLFCSAIVTDSKIEFETKQGDNYAVIYAANGDVNDDEKVNIVDLMQVLHHASGRKAMNVLQQGIADTDLNNSVNVQDLMRMMHYVSGRSSEL